MTNVEHATKDASIPDVIRIDQDQVRSHVEEVVRSTVEETLNALLDAEADEDRFAELSHILFDQATLAAGDSLKDPAGYVQRLNKLLLELSA